MNFIQRHLPTRLGTALWLAATWFASSASAQGTTDGPGVSGSAIGQMIVGLALIIGLLFFGAFALRKLNGGRGFGQTGPMRIVGGLMIGPRERVVMIEAGDSWIVIGIVPGQIRTLHTMPKGEMPAVPEAGAPFSHWLRKMSEPHDAEK